MAKRYLKSTVIIDFYGAPIITGYADDIGTVVPMKHIVEDHLGLDWKNQKDRLNDNDLYNPINIPGYSFNAYEIDMAGFSEEDLPDFSRNSEYMCLPKDEINLFLCQINHRKVKPECRENLIKYQKECGQALNDYWGRGFSYNSRTDPSRISSDRHDWCPRQKATASLARACVKYSAFTERHFEERIDPQAVQDFCNNSLSDLLGMEDDDSVFMEDGIWKGTDGALTFLVAFMERACFDILHMAMDKSIPPEDMQEFLETKIMEAWDSVGQQVIAVESPFTSFAGIGRGADRNSHKN